MTAKEYLMQLVYIDKRINTKLELVDKLRSMATKATTTLSDMPKGETPSPCSMENTIIKMVDLETELNHDIDRLVDLKAEARQVIGMLSDPGQQLILELRYLCFQKWVDIADALDKEERYVHKLHGKALVCIEKFISMRAVKDIE